MKQLDIYSSPCMRHCGKDGDRNLAWTHWAHVLHNILTQIKHTHTHRETYSSKPIEMWINDSSKTSAVMLRNYNWFDKVREVKGVSLEKVVTTERLEGCVKGKEKHPEAPGTAVWYGMIWAKTPWRKAAWQFSGQCGWSTDRTWPHIDGGHGCRVSYLGWIWGGVPLPKPMLGLFLEFSKDTDKIYLVGSK